MEMDRKQRFHARTRTAIKALLGAIEHAEDARNELSGEPPVSALRHAAQVHSLAKTAASEAEEMIGILLREVQEIQGANQCKAYLPGTMISCVRPKGHEGNQHIGVDGFGADKTWVEEAPPYPECMGAPTKADCIAVGYCKRNPSCGE